MPAGVIVPRAVFPPATPLTLQVTVGSVAFCTEAVKEAVLPRTTVPVKGAMGTVMEGGGGGGGKTELAPPPPQPSVYATAVRRTVNNAARVGVLEKSPMDGGRRILETGRMTQRNAGEGPAKLGWQIKLGMAVALETLR